MDQRYKPMQAIDKETGILMEVWPSSRRDDVREVFVSNSGFRYTPDELEFTKEKVEPQKVYVVIHNAHEYDDLDSGSFYPVFITTHADRARKFYDKLIQQARDLGRDAQATNGEDYYEEDPDNTDSEFCYYLGKWCYTYRLDEYLMECEQVIPKEE